MSHFTDLSHIEDPTEFLDTQLPKLTQLELLLRCNICKDFLNAPMLTSCGHTFCSLCVRKYLINTPKCPICAQELRESQLTRNVLLEQIVINFKNLRDDLLDIVQKPAVKHDTEVIEIKDVSQSSNDDLIILESKKRKVPNSIDSLIKRPRSSEPTKTSQCPICNKYFPIDQLQSSHIDECLSNENPSQAGPQATSNTNSFIKKLPKLDYSSLSTSQLKLKLSKLELPTSGTRNQLEARYNEYLVLWNANCDSVQPKDARVLRKNLNQWENSLKLGKSVKVKENNWNDLISKARKTLKNGGSSVEKEEHGGAQEEKKQDQDVESPQFFKS